MFSQLGRLLNALYLWTMKETPRIMAVTQQAFQEIFKDEVNGFPPPRIFPLCYGTDLPTYKMRDLNLKKVPYATKE